MDRDYQKILNYEKAHGLGECEEISLEDEREMAKFIADTMQEGEKKKE